MAKIHLKTKIQPRSFVESRIFSEITRKLLEHFFIFRKIHYLYKSRSNEKLFFKKY